MNATFVRSYADPSAMPSKGPPQVAFLGRSNVGKSSLINSLAMTKGLARTSAQPGRTKLVNVFDMSGKFHLVDLPGYGYARVSKEERTDLFDLIDNYLHTSILLHLAVVSVDARIGPTKDDRELIEHLRSNNIPFFLVVNKTDKLSRSELAKILSTLRGEFTDTTIFPHSAVTSAGRGELYDAILHHLTKN